MPRITNKEKIEKLKNNIIDLENFINSAFHDLKTPLFTLEGFLDLFYELYYDKVNEKGREYLDIMKDSIKRIEIMITDIFSLFKCEKILVKLDKKLYDIDGELYDDTDELSVRIVHNTLKFII